MCSSPRLSCNSYCTLVLNSFLPDTLDIEVTLQFLQKHGPVYPAEEGRIKFTTFDQTTTGAATAPVSNIVVALLTLVTALL